MKNRKFTKLFFLCHETEGSWKNNSQVRTDKGEHMTKLILCCKWGTKYGPQYVNRLYKMVARQVSPPFEVHCFTDDCDGILKGVICHNLPDLGVKPPTGVPGKWRKTAFWGAELTGLQGKALFIDLDTVIVGNIDCFFDYGEEKDVILARNWLKPLTGLGQTTLFRYYIGSHSYMLENFQKDPQGIAEKYRFEQYYVTRNIRGGVKFWPNKWVKHYRVHCLGNYVQRYIRPARIPSGAKIIAFPGDPNPDDALVGRWSGYEPVTRAQHIENLFRKKWVKNNIKAHISSFQMPCPWVAEHWTDV